MVHVLAGEGWSAGVVGIIAGKIANMTGRPSFVFGQEGDRYIGSGRSIPEFNVMDALEQTKSRLARYGGHPQACGMTIEGKENYQAFREELSQYATEKLAGLDLRPAIDVEAEISISQIDWKLINHLEKFEPYGEGNNKPNFLMTDLEVTSLACIGKDNRHVRIGIRGDGSRDLKMIGFSLAKTAIKFPPGSRIDVVVELGTNEWRGRKEIQIRLVDIRPAEGQKIRSKMTIVKEKV